MYERAERALDKFENARDQSWPGFKFGPMDYLDLSIGTQDHLKTPTLKIVKLDHHDSGGELNINSSKLFVRRSIDLLKKEGKNNQDHDNHLKDHIYGELKSAKSSFGPSKKLPFNSNESALLDFTPSPGQILDKPNTLQKVTSLTNPTLLIQYEEHKSGHYDDLQWPKVYD